MSSRRKSHRPQAASISHPILQTDGVSAIGRIASPTAAAFGQLSHAGPSASTSYASNSSAALPTYRRSPVSQNSTLPMSPSGSLAPSGAYTHAAARSRLTPPPSQPLAPAASLSNAEGGPSSLVSPGASAAIGIASLSRSPSANLRGNPAILEGFTRGPATGPASPGLADRGEHRIRVNSNDIELGAASRPSASLSLRQAKGSGNSQRGPFAHKNASARSNAFSDYPSDVFRQSSKAKERAIEGLTFDIHPTFRSDAAHRGNVLVKVEGVEFFVHADVLRFSSPFFESLLEGGWKESRYSWRSSIFEQAGDHGTGHDLNVDPHELDGDNRRVEQLLSQGPSLRTVVAEGSNDFAELQQTAPYKNAGLRSRGVRSSFVTAHTDLEDAGPSTPEWSQEPSATLTDHAEESGEDAHGSSNVHDDSGEQATLASANVSSSADLNGAREEVGASSAEPFERTTSAENDNQDSADPCVRETGDESTASVEQKGFPRLYGDDSVATDRKRILRRSASEGSLPAAISMAGSAAPSGANDAGLPGGGLHDLATPSASPRLAPSRLSEDSLAEGHPDLHTHLHADDLPAKQKLPKRPDGVKAMIELHEESASTFQNFLFYIYPHLDLQITWLSCGSLLAFADKIGAPYLHRACLDFLRASLAGKPIEAMRLAEMHRLADVYKEASRHVLDNWTAWEKEDLELLSSETLLKLERRRSWFLERVLKLGLANPLRDYECHAACPDPGTCAKALHAHWSAGYAASCRFAPPQPSGIWRYLREFDGQPPLPHSACNSAAKAWRELLFDRMFNLPSIPHGGRTVRQFLHVKLEH